MGWGRGLLTFLGNHCTVHSVLPEAFFLSHPAQCGPEAGITGNWHPRKLTVSVSSAGVTTRFLQWHCDVFNVAGPPHPHPCRPLLSPLNCSDVPLSTFLSPSVGGSMHGTPRMVFQDSEIEAHNLAHPCPSCRPALPTHLWMELSHHRPLQRGKLRPREAVRLAPGH